MTWLDLHYKVPLMRVNSKGIYDGLNYILELD